MVVNTLTFTLSPPASITRTRVPGMPPQAAGDLYLVIVFLGIIRTYFR